MPEGMLSIPQWFAGQHILITGATGFMGKVLIEKLLRCCPNVACLYLLVRPKRGRSVTERLEDFINDPVFDVIRDSPVSSLGFSKLHCICGDLTQNNLNFSKEDLQVLQENVTTVFHMAANVRFDQPLKTALIMNTGGTLKILELAENFKKLTAFVHVSTSYCHCDQTELKEEFYPAPHNPRDILNLLTWMDDELFTLLTPKLLNNAPNTYAYTKCLTEQLVGDFAKKIPIAIARPSIVIAAWKQPIPGWVNNLNGPTGLLVGAGKGVIRSMHCDPNFQADVIPVDVCMNSIILTAWKLGNSPRVTEPFVVNVTASHVSRFFNVLSFIKSKVYPRLLNNKPVIQHV
ncbi:hypothetical protein ILUMI_09748 [Ignelater luminosus]|uniref:Fatty acyl-CoA reductase n=1 Tax=Ignelater luminosus TaxID=2038154 RepID=A0A8K0D8I3_IGNLU|nr:hypothetical protein ILUMI_09748 [Ignelater luminosus]